MRLSETLRSRRYGRFSRNSGGGERTMNKREFVYSVCNGINSKNQTEVMIKRKKKEDTIEFCKCQQ